MHKGAIGLSCATNDCYPLITIYRILYPLVFLLLLPKYLLRMRKRGGYKKDFGHRFGKITRVPPRGAKKRIWLQAVSVGEVNAIEPLLRLLVGQGYEVVLTTTTSTGYALATEKYSALCAAVGIFPIDWPPFSRESWNRINPDLAILMESELWPEHLEQARKRKVPVVLLNGRMSDRSYRRYKKVRWARSLFFERLTLICASTRQDAERLTDLAGASRVRFTGNIKFDVEVNPRLDESGKVALLGEMGFASNTEEAPLVVLGSSTWPGEEESLLRILRTLNRHGHNARLLLVPRHAERRNELKELLGRQDFRWHLRSVARQAPSGTQVYIADTTGELKMFTQVATIVFVGKSMPPHDGGQTPIEAAVLGKPILFGPRMSNFRDVARSLRDCGAAHLVSDEENLETEIVRLVANPQERNAMATRATEWIQRHKGASGRSAEAVNEIMLAGAEKN